MDTFIKKYNSDLLRHKNKDSKQTKWLCNNCKAILFVMYDTENPKDLYCSTCRKGYISKTILVKNFHIFKQYVKCMIIDDCVS